MTGTWSFDFETTDRASWPASFGRVTVLADSYIEAFETAHALVACAEFKSRRWLPRVEMVTALWCVDWPEEAACTTT